jgi:DUF2892 family protein
MFKRNEGILDRIVRVALGVVLLPTGLFLLGGLQGSVPGLIVTGLGAIGLITGATGYCPTYTLFGFSTLEMEKQFIERCRSMMGARGASGCMSAGSMCGPRPQSSDKAPEQVS